MKHLIIISVVVVGCFATAQLRDGWTRYKPMNPIRFDSFRTSGRVPQPDEEIKMEAIPTTPDDHHIRLMLDAHIVCLTELKATKKRLGETNDAVENLKQEMKADISDLKKEVAAIKDSSQVNADVEMIESQLKENSQVLLGTVTDVRALQKELAVTKQDASDALQRYKDEMNGSIEQLNEELSVTARSLTDAKTEIAFLKIELDGAKKQSSDTSSFVEALLTRWTATDFAVGDLIKELNETRTEALESSVQIEELANVLKASTSSSSIGQMPQSCADLRKIGHVKSGLHLIMGDKNVESVYCDFTLDDQSLQKWIGFTDVKSAPVYFSVQRTNRFSSVNMPIPFDLARSSIGNAMNLATGIFTAPRAGTYFFVFNGLAEFETSTNVIPYLAVGLILNKSGNRIAVALTEEAHTIQDNYRGQRVPLALQTTIQLQAGDQVWLEIFGESGTISLFDNKNNHSAFTGWLLQEDMSLL